MSVYLSDANFSPGQVRKATTRRTAQLPVPGANYSIIQDMGRENRMFDLQGVWLGPTASGLRDKVNVLYSDGGTFVYSDAEGSWNVGLLSFEYDEVGGFLYGVRIGYRISLVEEQNP